MVRLWCSVVDCTCNSNLVFSGWICHLRRPCYVSQWCGRELGAHRIEGFPRWADVQEEFAWLPVQWHHRSRAGGPERGLRGVFVWDSQHVGKGFKGCRILVKFDRVLAVCPSWKPHSRCSSQSCSGSSLFQVLGKPHAWQTSISIYHQHWYPWLQISSFVFYTW